MADLVESIDASKAEAFALSDKQRIHGEISRMLGSLATFTGKLRLHLMLSPLSYKADVDRLWKRAAGTQWNFERIAAWAQDPNGTRMLVIPAGSGTGKSTISAALLSHGATRGLIAAHHFFKYNDQRRLDMVALIKSLAHQLADT
jgi:hypothetical protein